ncbi:ATP-grasp domain-containing protein [candidate division WOR-3 bacterium]|nr:ATP-grasp domain-containing protein [candidate division WOR-3 bacterium]
MTYDLRDEYLAEGYSKEETAELDSDITIEAIEKAVKSAGFEVERVGSVKKLIEALACGKRWDVVFNISEGIRGTGREALVPALLDHYKIEYTFSGPLTMAATLDKPTAKIIAWHHNIPTPDFFVVSHGQNIPDYARKMKYPLFVKPAAEGSGKGVSTKSIVNDFGELKNECKRLAEFFSQPVIVEKFLCGREYTTALLENSEGVQIIGTAEVIFNDNAEGSIYSYSNKEKFETRVRYEIVEGKKAKNCAELAMKAWTAFSCRDCARVDFRENAEGEIEFLEINPLPGLNPLRSDLPIIAELVKMDYNDLILKILESAIKRLRKE